jgi:hypothetical protein
VVSRLSRPAAASAACIIQVLSGCSDLLSVHPLATAETAVFDAGLMGEWLCAGKESSGFFGSDKNLKGVALIRAGSAQKKDYDIVWLPDEGEALRLQRQLVKVGDRLVFDLIDVKHTDQTGLTVQAHFFMLVEKTAEGVKFHWLDSKWLRSQVTSQDGLAHVMMDDKTVITAGSAEISTFLAKFGLDPQATSGSLSFKPVKGQ